LAMTKLRRNRACRPACAKYPGRSMPSQLRDTSRPQTLLKTPAASASSFTRRQYVSAIGERDLAAARIVGAVPRLRAFNVDDRPDLESAFGNASSQQHSRRRSRESPRGDLSALVFHVDVKPDVWIFPLDAFECARHFDRLRRIVLRRL